MTLLYHGAWYFPRFLFHPFVVEFALGCVVFYTQALVRGVLSWLLLIAGLAYMLAFSRHTGSLGLHLMLLSSRLDLAWLRVLLWGLPSAFIVAGLVGLERNDGYVLPRFLVWLGGISYSLYLTHRFSMAIVTMVGRQIGLHSTMLVILLVVAISILVAWLCWRLLEQPLTARAQRWARLISRRKEEVKAVPATSLPIAEIS